MLLNCVSTYKLLISIRCLSSTKRLTTMALVPFLLFFPTASHSCLTKISFGHLGLSFKKVPKVLAKVRVEVSCPECRRAYIRETRRSIIVSRNIVLRKVPNCSRNNGICNKKNCTSVGNKAYNWLFCISEIRTSVSNMISYPSFRS